MKVFYAIVFSAALVSPAEADTLICDDGMKKLAAPARFLTSVPLATDVKPEQIARAELRALLPEMGAFPTFEQAQAHADKILGVSIPSIREGKIPVGELATLRAGEIYEALRRAGAKLTDPQSALADAYTETRQQLFQEKVSVPLEGLTPEQQVLLKDVVSLLGVEPVILENKLFLAHVSSDEDLTALGRAMYLLKDFKRGDESFDSSLDRFLDSTADILGSRATAHQVTALPRVFRRWEGHSMQGRHASRQGAKTFRDPTGRILVLDIPQRTISKGKIMPAEIEGVQLVPLVDENDAALVGLRVSSRLGEKDHTDPSKCVGCHRTSGSELWTLVPRSKMPDEGKLRDDEVMPGISLATRFVSSRGLRNSGMAKKDLYDEVEKLVESD